VREEDREGRREELKEFDKQIDTERVTVFV